MGGLYRVNAECCYPFEVRVEQSVVTEVLFCLRKVLTEDWSTLVSQMPDF